MRKKTSFLCYLRCFIALLLSFFFTNIYAHDGVTFDKVKSFHFAPSPNYLPTKSKLNKEVLTSLNQIRQNFSSPGVDFATAPLWVWNDLLTEDQIRSTLEDFNRQNVNMAFVHPRPGLVTPYLTEDWFKLWDVALDEASKRGMKIWIYDENSYPSGFAGGYVPNAFPELRGAGLDVVFMNSLLDNDGKWQAGDCVKYVIEQLSDGSTIDRTNEVLNAKTHDTSIPDKSPNGIRWIVGRIQYSGTSQWFGGKTYVNLMEKETLDAFIGFTHEAYRKRFANQFGKIIPGVFTDEPNVAPSGMFSWCTDFPEEFQRRCGYDLIPHLGSLLEPIGNWKKIRYDYFKTVLEIFIERWHKPMAEYCERVGLEYTGHDWEHEWPNAHHCPDNMATAFWRQRPAIDLLMNNFSRGVHSQFGNVRAVRELNSVTRQAGRCRSISENYGAGGYDIKFEDLKRLGDWSYALGVNTTDEHLSYISIRGARKHDHPQTFSYHSPWFEHYSKLEDYWTRLSYALSRGKLSSNRFLLLEPTSTVWLYQHNAGVENNGKKDRIGNEFTELLNRLEAAQLDYDLGSEDVISRVGSVENGVFRVGAAQYKTVVLPNSVENIDIETLNLLSTFVQHGGKVISLGAALTHISGTEASQLDKQSQTTLEILQSNLESQTFEELLTSRQSEQRVIISTTNETNVFHQLRETQDALILFICNVDLKDPAQGTIRLNDISLKSCLVESLDALTGTIKEYPCSNNVVSFELQPCCSLLLAFSQSEHANKKVIANNKPINYIDPWKLSANFIEAVPCDDNVLVLDYMTVKLQNDVIKDEYFYRANQWFWNKKGYQMSPWDNGVQFKDELLTQKFKDDSGFEIHYQFNKSNEVVDKLHFVVENPDLYKVYCNNQKVSRIPQTWKYDRSFGVFDISAAVKDGCNTIKLVAEKSTIFCELMPAWIVGNFTLEPTNKGFTIVANKGLIFTSDNKKQFMHPKASSASEQVSWLSAGVNFSDISDRNPNITFQVKHSSSINSLQIWNYCESNLSKRGIKSFELKVLDKNGSSKFKTKKPEIYELKEGNGYSQTIILPHMLQVEPTDKIVFSIQSNWNGITYPLSDKFVGNTSPDNDNAFVGLAKVKFFDENNNQVECIASASSELFYRSHDRRASYIVDGSGLAIPRYGWATQGRPFYSGAVDYKFELTTSDYPCDNQTVFELPDRNKWDGAVVVLFANEKQIGSIGWSGERIDLTSVLSEAHEAGQDKISLTVRVYGTPKNLFGPHHAGQLRGSAWPSSFHSAPKQQPSGSSYDVIEYGLF